MTGGEARHRRPARYACLFRIKPELKAEYKKAHDEIWPDMARAIRRSGIRNYSIHFRDDGTLFSYFECRDPDKAFACMSRQEVNGRWQRAMARFFVRKDPSILGPGIEPLEEVFHQD